MLLTLDEVAALTRRGRPKAQARVLRLLGIPFATHPTDGTLIVSRAAVELVLGVAQRSPIIDEEFDVNVEKVRKHGTPSAAH